MLTISVYNRKKENEVSQSCPTLCNPMDYCSPPGSSIHGILQARILEWVAIAFSRGSSWPRDRTQVSHIAGRHFNLWATREVLMYNRWPEILIGWIKIIVTKGSFSKAYLWYVCVFVLMHLCLQIIDCLLSFAICWALYMYQLT